MLDLLTEKNGFVTRCNGLQNGVDIIAACKLVARHYGGPKGEWAYECFEHINVTFFDGALPWPLILWGLTFHGHCLGLTRIDGRRPVITLHPSILRGTEKPNPWRVDPALLGVCYAYDVLIHECIHVQVEYILGGWQGKAGGKSSHNNPLWVAEVNRIAPLLGLFNVQAGTSKLKRIPIDGQTTKTGKPATRPARRADGNIPFPAVSTFPYSVRVIQGKDDFYRQKVLPYASRFKGADL